MRTVFLDAKTMGKVPNIDVFNKFGEYTVYPTTKPEERIARIGNADILITNKVIIDKDTMDHCPQLKLICVTATGTNNIDLDYARIKGISVKNVSNYSTESVAQMTLGMILHLTNQLNYFDRYVKSGEYTRSDIFTHYGPEFYELKGKRAGIIGLGNIGKRVATLLETLGMQIVYYSTSGKNNNNDYQRLELDDLLATSQVVSIHAPLNDQTKNLISLSQLKLMRSTAILINAGRGGIVSEHDLADAINQKLIAGAGIDVYEREPMATDSPLLKVLYPERLVLTPHSAWASIEARTRLIEKVVVNIEEFLAANNAKS